MATVTVHDLFEELQSFMEIEPIYLLHAAKSKVTNKNNPDFRVLLNDWTSGRYDNDPELLLQRLKKFL